MTQLTEHFTQEELTYSRIAIENGWDNTPSPSARAALQQLAARLLQPLREQLGAPIAITSGYRSAKVNRAAGGVPHSSHLKGEAADCFTAAGPEHLLKTLLASGLPFDQAILYKRRRFLHLSYREGKNRKEILHLK